MNLDDIRKNWKSAIRIKNPHNYALEVLVEESGIILRAFDFEFHQKIHGIAKDVNCTVVDGSKIETR